MQSTDGRASYFAGMVVTPADITALEAILGAAQHPDERTWYWHLTTSDTPSRTLALTLCSTTLPDGSPSLLASVQTAVGYIELHGVSHYLCMEPDEVMFLARQGNDVSSMVIGRSCTCSQFANVHRDLLGTDLVQLDPALLMAAVQIALADSLTLP